MEEPGMFILMDAKIRKTVTFFTIVTVIMFSVGVAIGYICGINIPLRKDPVLHEDLAQTIKRSCSARSIQTDDGKLYLERIIQREENKFSCVHKAEDCWDHRLPRHYAAYHLGEKGIKIDGRLDEGAWTEVDWSDEFEDIRNSIYPKPFYSSKFKMRWDENNLYIGVEMEEKHLWATYNNHDSKVYQENALEIFLCVDGSMLNYKQVDINALGTVMDLAVGRSQQTSNSTSSGLEWNATIEIAIHREGTLNTFGDEDKFWSVELSIPFETLSEQSDRVRREPEDNEVWFVQLGKSQPNLTVENGTYQHGPYFNWHWWAWQPCFAHNMHLQDRWGLVQFKTNLQDSKFRFQLWHIYRSLFDVFDALQKYKAINGLYTYELQLLDVPTYLWSRACVEIPSISFHSAVDFNVTVTSLLLPGISANISSEKRVVFN